MTHVRAALSVNPIFEGKGLDAFLLPIEVPVADLADVVPGLAKLGNVNGFIITISHQETMALVRRVGSAGENSCLKPRGSVLAGD